MSGEIDALAVDRSERGLGWFRKMRLRYLLGAALVLALLTLGLFLLLRDRGIPADAADGSYAHDCCGTIEVRKGRLSFGTERSVGYVVERDSVGPYILPDIYVGPWEESGFEIDGSRPPLKLRLDRLPRPGTIELASVTKSFSFKRKALKLRRRAKRAAIPSE